MYGDYIHMTGWQSKKNTYIYNILRKWTLPSSDFRFAVFFIAFFNSKVRKCCWTSKSVMNCGLIDTESNGMPPLHIGKYEVGIIFFNLDPKTYPQKNCKRSDCKGEDYTNGRDIVVVWRGRRSEQVT
mmetsp:Transcript_34613/g.45764  ORF Transcript_34613/g.45764 Transcript_34613/m.45764 type:complete len:127 (-) Transcript_34613:999-1379(-)